MPLHKGLKHAHTYTPLPTRVNLSNLIKPLNLKGLFYYKMKWYSKHFFSPKRVNNLEGSKKMLWNNIQYGKDKFGKFRLIKEGFQLLQFFQILPNLKQTHSKLRFQVV